MLPGPHAKHARVCLLCESITTPVWTSDKRIICSCAGSLFCNGKMGEVHRFRCDLKLTLHINTHRLTHSRFVSFNPLLLAADRLHWSVWACSQTLCLSVCVWCFRTFCGLWAFGFVVWQDSDRAKARHVLCLHLFVRVCVFSWETLQSSCLKITPCLQLALPLRRLYLHSFASFPWNFKISALLLSPPRFQLFPPLPLLVCLSFVDTYAPFFNHSILNLAEA